MKNRLTLFVALVLLIGLGQLAHAQAATTTSVTLNWAATTLNTNGSAASGVTYNVYQGAKGAELSTPVLTSLTGVSTTISGIPLGTQTCFVMKAVENGQISTASNEACATPAAVPPTPTPPATLTITCPVPASTPATVTCTVQ